MIPERPICSLEALPRSIELINPVGPIRLAREGLIRVCVRDPRPSPLACFAGFSRFPHMSLSTPSRASSAGRLEVIHNPGQAVPATIVPGVTLRSLVDARAGAEGLFAGLLTVEPGARFPFYARPVTEALTLLVGDAAVDVEDRRYRLAILDNATLPPQVPRRIVNLSTAEPAVLHVALAACEPVQTWVNARFTSEPQSSGSRGRDHGERICRSDAMARYELAPRAQFQNLFSAELGSSGLCGGYGLFDPGARLPCHRVEFDKSITIIQGTATCIVEGRRHDLLDSATLFVPRGRSHYVINLTLDPMVMIWVHAGDRPDRIIVDETFCHPERARTTR